MCRKCPIDGCEVLLANTVPMCERHWERVPASVRQTVDAAARRLANAPTVAAQAHAQGSYDAAMRMAITEATKARPVGVMGRASGLPSGPRTA